MRSWSRRPTGLSAKAVTTAVSRPKPRLRPRATLYSPPPSQTSKERVVAIRRSPGSNRNITSPSASRSQRQFSLALILSGMKSPRHPTAIDHQHMAVQIIAGGGSQENGNAGEILGSTPAAGGDAVEDGAAAGGIGAQSGGIVGGHIAGSDGVDVDALGGPFIGERLGQLGDCAFGGGIGRDQDAALEGQQRSDVDNFAAALCEHVAAGQLAEAEDRVEIDLDDVGPIPGGIIHGRGAADDAGIVNEDVDGAEFADSERD